MNRRIVMLALAAALLSCKREIEIDYRSVAPIYVAEVELTTQWVTARLTTTYDIKGSKKN